MSLILSDNLILPDEAITQTFAILAKRGVGKTYTASVMAEEMLKAGLHTVIVDPIGVWWGLRTSADGKKPGLHIIVVGGEHGDIPLEPTSGELIANLVVDQGISMVIDISLMRKNEQKRFMVDFAETLYHKNRAALHLILDEADEFAPQRPMGDDARMLGAIEDLVRRGRARGIGVTLITQRPAVLNKNVLTQIEVLIGMRLTSPQDRQALNEWVKYHADSEAAQLMITSLPQLPIGTAWFWSPGWLDMFKKVAIRKRETFDSSSTPKVGENAVKATKVAKVDLDDLRQQMAATIEKQQAEDPKLLRRRIVELEREIKSQPEPEQKIVEKPIITDEQMDFLKTSLPKLIEIISPAIKLFSGQLDLIDESMKNGASEDMTVNIARPRRRVSTYYGSPFPAKASDRQDESPNTAEVKLRAGERRILETLARHAPMRFTRTQLGTLSRFKASGGTFGTYFGTLKRTGLLQDDNGEITITKAGMDYLGANIPQPTTTEELLQMWYSALRAGERKMLDELVRVYPATLGRDELGSRAGFTATGGTFGTYLGSLRRNGLIEEANGEVRASDTLFLGNEINQRNNVRSV